VPVDFATCWELLRLTLLGGSVRLSFQKLASPSRRARIGFFNETATYLGGSKTLIVCPQVQFTIGHVFLGMRPRPANKSKGREPTQYDA
jgi:hypothetical protein